MFRLTAVVTAVLALASGSLSGESDRTPGSIVDTSLQPVVVTTGADAEQRSQVSDVVDRFERAGLALPDLEIRFADDPETCRGHDGLFQRQWSPWRIVVCSDAAYVIAHELAHAWEAANLTDDARAAFAQRFGFGTWDGRDAAWRDRAEEFAAYAIQQNLMVTSGRADSPRWVERIEAFELLTGVPSPKRSA